MARKKKTKKKNKNVFGGIKAVFTGDNFVLLRKFVFIMVPVFIGIAGVAAGLGYLEGYVKNVASERNINLELEFTGEKPYWASSDLISEINISSGICADDFLLDDDLVKQAYEALSSNPWVMSINTVRKCYSGAIQFDYTLREPVANIAKGNQIYYLDADGVVMPYSPVDKHLVRIEGSYHALPKAGTAVKQTDVLAALEILKNIQEVDNNLSNETDMIWSEFAVIDVSNFEGRKDPNKSHINLYTHKNTEIRWGAAINREISEFEANKKIKLTRLYQTYRYYGTLDINTSGLDLRDHR